MTSKMIHALILRFDAPLLSFGGTAVDNDGITNQFPGRSLFTGLIANALGYEHCEFEKLTRLQERIQYAVRCDRPGSEMVDFQTVDLSQGFLRRGWTTRGQPEGRDGSVSTQTHIRYRHYLVDSIFTTALTLSASQEGEEPTLEDVGFALREPERPLFLGRKSCIPSMPILLTVREGTTLRSILERVHACERGAKGSLTARWPFENTESSETVFVTEDRDWANQIHIGRRSMQQGTMVPEPWMTQVHASSVARTDLEESAK